MKERNTQNVGSVDQRLDFSSLDLFSEVVHVLVEDCLLLLDFLALKGPSLSFFMHPSLGHQVLDDVPELVFGFVHDVFAINSQEFKVSLDRDVVLHLSQFSPEFFVQVFVNVVKDHSQLLSVAFFATEVHQNFVSKLDSALSDQNHDLDLVSDQFVKAESSSQLLD